MTTKAKVVTHIGVGKANAMSVAALENAIGGTPSGTNNDDTRGLVKDMIMNDHVPIGSTSYHGYWLIDSDNECDDVCDQLDRMIQTYTDKRDAIRSGWARRKASKAAGTPWPK